MAFADLPNSVSERHRRLGAVLVQATDLASQQLGQLGGKIAQEEARQDRKEGERSRRLLERVDVERVREKLEVGDWTKLERREASYAARCFWLFAPELLVRFFKARPEQRSRFLKAALRTWGTWAAGTSAQWDGYVDICREWPESVWPIGQIPIQRAKLLAHNGVSDLIRGWAGRPLGDLLELLQEAKIRSWWDLYGYVIVEWLRRSAVLRVQVSADLEVSLKSHNALALVLPTESGRAGSRDLQVRFLAAVLRCRMLGLMGGEEFANIERVLLSSRSIFGDPRVERRGSAWEDVRGVDGEAFDRYLQTLIREDLRFFFEHAMKEEERGNFWLNYLGSIQRTTCFLDSTSYDRVRIRVRAQTNEVRSAFERAQRLPGEVSAFCLYFRDFAVVEFSENGWAVYLYERNVFEQEIIGRRAFDAGHFRQPKRKHDKWNHHQGWQARFVSRLRELGIHPDHAT